MVEIIINYPEHTKEHAFYISKLNSTLISIVKYEWRTTWQNFIPDICAHAKQSENKCENALNILRIMSEEIFDFSKGQILQSETAILKKSLNDSFTEVY